MWTAARSEEEGIHIHAFGDDPTQILIDDTFADVRIDGVTLDPIMCARTWPRVRFLIYQAGSWAFIVLTATACILIPALTHSRRTITMPARVAVPGSAAAADCEKR